MFPRDSVAPNHWKTGAIIGGIIGLAGGFVVVKLADSVGDETISTAGALSVAGLFGLVGALIGGLIGSFSHK